MEQNKTRHWLVNYRGSLTHQQVAEMAGISRSYYTEIELGEKNPSVATAKKIALVLGFEWTLFFKEDGRDKQHITLNSNTPPTIMLATGD